MCDLFLKIYVFSRNQWTWMEVRKSWETGFVGNKKSIENQPNPLKQLHVWCFKNWLNVRRFVYRVFRFRWVLRDWISCLFSSTLLFPLSWCRCNSRPASEPAPLCPDLLCNWKNWREADSGGYRLWSLNVYFQPLFLIVWRSWVDIHICHWLLANCSQLSSSLSVLIQPAEGLLVVRVKGQGGSASLRKSWLNVNKVLQQFAVWDNLCSLCWRFAFL